MYGPMSTILYFLQMMTEKELLDFHNQELTIGEIIEMHKQEQDIEELQCLDPVPSEDQIMVGNLTEGLSLKNKY
ncbi:hypothetical protein TNCV_2853901 [Trichonephila clavipes]|uniref:Uncharacterized protein n=1 Tax=Trichonephila clavipes TaxID=2585209 RepID=A0A8X6RC84_TRICX|nr:hypothetical protein TNCV_2853901 [Trichonephila clavipes]